METGKFMKNKPIKDNIKNIYGNEPTTMDELGFAMIKIIDSYPYTLSKGIQSNINNKNSIKCLGLAWNLIHFDRFYNSFTAPEGHKIKIWRNIDDTQHSGWMGRLWVRFNSEFSIIHNDIFKLALAHTGTGGTGTYDGPWNNVSAMQFNRFGSGLDSNSYPRPWVYSWYFHFYYLESCGN